MSENQKPKFVGTVQYKDPTSGFITVGKVKFYEQTPPTDGKKHPVLKGYMGLFDKEFLEISLW